MKNLKSKQYKDGSEVKLHNKRVVVVKKKEDYFLYFTKLVANSDLNLEPNTLISIIKRDKVSIIRTRIKLSEEALVALHYGLKETVGKYVEFADYVL